MKEKILALLQRHQTTLASDIAEITAVVDRLANLDDDGLVLLHRQIHTLKGSSGSLGFDAVFRAAERMEHGVKARLGQGIRGDDVPAIRQDLVRLQRLIAAARIEDSTLYEKFGLSA